MAAALFGDIHTSSMTFTDASSRVGSEILARIEKLVIYTTVLEAVKLQQISRAPSPSALCAEVVAWTDEATEEADADKSDPENP